MGTDIFEIFSRCVTMKLITIMKLTLTRDWSGLRWMGYGHDYGPLKYNMKLFNLLSANYNITCKYLRIITHAWLKSMQSDAYVPYRFYGFNASIICIWPISKRRTIIMACLFCKLRGYVACLLPLSTTTCSVENIRQRTWHISKAGPACGWIVMSCLRTLQ